MVRCLGAYHGAMSPSLPDRRSGRPSPGGPGGPGPGGTGGQAASGGDQSWRWVFALLILAVFAVLIIPPLLSKPAVKQIPYKNFLQQYVEAHGVKSATVNNNTGVITGELKNGQRVSLKFDALPFDEVGAASGHVVRILDALPSGVKLDAPEAGGVVVQVEIDDMPAGAGPVRSGMTFTGDVLTRWTRLLSLLFGEPSHTP